MTAIGKMLTFLVLLLSVGWFYLTANAYVARTNWRTEAERSSKEVEKANRAAASAVDLIRSDRDAGDDARKALVAERDRLADQVTKLQADRKVLEDQYTAAFADAQKKDGAAVQQQANIAKLNLEVKTKDDQLAANLKQINDLTLAAEKSKADAAKSDLARTAAEKAAENLRDTIAGLQRDLLLAQNGGPGAGGSVPAPRGLSGTVKQFVPGRNVVSLTPGLDAGLKVGAVVIVTRFDKNNNGLYLGRVTITHADPKECAGDFVAATRERQRTPDDDPRPGDRISQ